MSILDISPVIPVVVLDDEADAVPVATALLGGGIGIIEITLRTPAGLGAIAAVAEQVPDMVVGAGTVVQAGQAKAASDAGARFLVSPATTLSLLTEMDATGLSLLPGSASVGEALALREAGYRELKLYPASIVGGPGMLKAIGDVLPDLRFCPTGGITVESAPSYLAAPNVACVGGSWIVPKDAVAARDWSRITALASEAATLRP